jgi:hypothetical protein
VPWLLITQVILVVQIYIGDSKITKVMSDRAIFVVQLQGETSRHTALTTYYCNNIVQILMFPNCVSPISNSNLDTG